MAQLPSAFDATQHEPRTGPPPPLPSDWYNSIITESEVKLTKKGRGDGGVAGTGEWLVELTLKVLDGPYVGRLFWDRLNLGNLNTVAVEIANSTMSSICHAVNVFQVPDTSVLHGHPLMARVIEKAPEGGYDAGNDVKGYAKIGEKESKNGQDIKLEPKHGAAPKTPSQPPHSGAAEFTPPWSGEPAAPAPVAPAAPAIPQAPVPPVPAAPAAPATPGAPPWVTS